MTTYYIYDNDQFFTEKVIAEVAPDNATTMEAPEVDPGTKVCWCSGYWVVSADETNSPELPSKPTLVITSITGGLYANNELTLPVGATLTATGEIQLGGVTATTFSDSFRMPIKATDGREKVLLATVTNGVASITWTPKESGIWNITEALMNRDLPTESHLSFRGLKIFVLE